MHERRETGLDTADELEQVVKTAKDKIDKAVQQRDEAIKLAEEFKKALDRALP